MTEMLWKLGGLGPALINASEDARGMVLKTKDIQK